MTESIKQIPLKTVFQSAYIYMRRHAMPIRLFIGINFVFLAAFRFIAGGFSNPWSMLWLLGYYMFWCAFFRYRFERRPYLTARVVFGSMIPSTKIFFITFVAAFLLVILPYLPLLMGFTDKYLAFFEKYMLVLQNVDADFLNVCIFTFVLLLISPFIICRPFFAWMASLQDMEAFMSKAFEKTRGNYGRFVQLMMLLNVPCVVVFELDKLLGCRGWFTVGFYAIFFVYFNLVFAELDDFFYPEKTYKTIYPKKA